MMGIGDAAQTGAVMPMPRQAKLRRKNGYWYTSAGGESGKYFGRIGDVSYGKAREAFADYLKSIGSRRARPGSRLTVADLVDKHIEWAQAHRSYRTYDERKRQLGRFANFKSRAGVIMGDLDADSTEGADLMGFVTYLTTVKKVDPLTADKHAASVKAAYNWGSKQGLLPVGCRPFTNVEKYRKPDDPLLEGDLPTSEEIAGLMAHADDDFEEVREGKGYRKRRPDEFRTGNANPYAGFGDLLRVYHITGARTSELLQCTVADFVRSSGMLVLGRHKRSRTMRVPVPRRITLNAEARGIVERWCKGKSGSAPIFTEKAGRAWNKDSAAARFALVREAAGVREEISIYSFRHLWISEALMCGVDVATVSKMSGTSIAMIEKVYGHFTGEHFQEAQKQLDAARIARAAKLKASAA